MKSHHNSDPSQSVGNRRVKNGARALAAAAALTLAACSPQSGDKEPKAIPAPTHPTLVPETKSMSPKDVDSVERERKNEELKQRAQLTAENFAERIVETYKTGSGIDKKFIYDEHDGSNVAVNVLYNTKTLIAGEYGEYGLVASLKRNSDGSFDTKSVDMISVFENVNITGTEVAKNPDDRLNVFSYFLTKDLNGDWSVRTSRLDKGGDTNEITGDSGSTSNTMDSAQFEMLSNEAATVLEWAKLQAPVNYVPEVRSAES
jgi:hypothetical protein